MSFAAVNTFEEQIAAFYGAPHAVATDCCTHAIELCLRDQEIKRYSVPKRTYISVPFLARKLNIDMDWRDENWKDYYYLGGTNIVDAAVLWKEKAYIPDTFMCLSFQFRKHLSLGRGGMILTDNAPAANPAGFHQVALLSEATATNAPPIPRARLPIVSIAWAFTDGT